MERAGIDCEGGLTRMLLTPDILGGLAGSALCVACAAAYMLRPRHSAPGNCSTTSLLEGIISYKQLWVDVAGETHVAQDLAFGSLEKKGYSGACAHTRSIEL